MKTTLRQVTAKMQNYLFPILSVSAVLLLILTSIIIYFKLPRHLQDSPWTWFVLFGGFAVTSLMLMAPKYSQVQAMRENRFQNRETAMQWQGEEIESAEAIEAARMPQADGSRKLLIPLQPLLLAGVVIVLIGLIGLSTYRLRQKRQKARESMLSQ